MFLWAESNESYARTIINSPDLQGTTAQFNTALNYAAIHTSWSIKLKVDIIDTKISFILYPNEKILF